MTEQGSPEWLAARRQGLGGSEVSALYQLADGSSANPWLSQHALWLDKTGRISVERTSIKSHPHLYWGTALEPVVRKAYADLTGRVVVDGDTLLRHSSAPMVANTDGTIIEVEGKDGPGVYEGKASTVFSRSDWYDEDGSPSLPLHYQVQVQHYLACTGYRWASLAVYFGGRRQPLEWFDIERHEGVIADLEDRTTRWWRTHVELDEPPPLDSTPGTEQALRAASPTDSGHMVKLPSGFEAVIDRLNWLDSMTSANASERQRLRNIIISTLGHAAYGETVDGRGFTFRTEKSGQRKLRIASHARMDRARKETQTERPGPAFVPPGVGAAVSEVEGWVWQAREWSRLWGIAQGGGSSGES